MRNSKLKKFLLVLVVLVIIALGGARVLIRKKPSLPTTLTPSPLGFGSIVTQVPEEIQVKAEAPVLPKTIKAYQIKPAPFELFSPQAAQIIAQNLGFTAEASATTSGNLYLYQEEGKTLSIDKIAGTINYSAPFNSLTAGAIDENSAKAAVKNFFKTLGLDQPFFGWDKAEVKAYTLVGGIPRETATTTSVYFLEFVPKFDLQGYKFLASFPIFVRVGQDGEIVGLSFWYPNLDSKNTKEVAIKSFAEAQKEIQQGNGVIVKAPGEKIERLKLTEADLAYFVPTDYLIDFSKPNFTKLIYVFSGDGTVVYLPAEKEEE